MYKRSELKDQDYTLTDGILATFIKHFKRKSPLYIWIESEILFISFYNLIVKPDVISLCINSWRMRKILRE